VITGGAFKGSMKAVDNMEELLYGKMPDSSDKILISSVLLNDMLSSFEIDNNYTHDQVFTGEISDDDINKVFAKKFALNYNDLFEVYVSGIYVSNDSEMRFTNELIQEMLKVDPIAIDIYVSNPDKVSTIKDSINANAAFEAITQLETLKNNVSMQTRFFSIALILLGIVLLLISVAMLSSFSKIDVLERKKEVAIIKSLGANNFSVLSILLFDSALIALLSFLLALLLFTVLQFALPYILPNVNVLNFRFPFLLILLISMVFTFLTLMQTVLSLRKLVIKTPAELFAQ
jgi:ABC-type antimicrobial peptide transport system permease subunit